MFSDKWQNFINSKTKDISFPLEKSNLEQMIKLFMSQTDIDEIHREFIDPCQKNLFKKSDTKSEKYRLDGNHHYLNRSFKVAMDFYNKAIISSTHGKDEFAFAFSNRSALFYKMKNYQACLSDITNAFSSDYKSKYKLYIRRGQCLFYLKNYSQALNAFEDAYNDLNNALSKKIEIPKDKDSINIEIQKWFEKIKNKKTNKYEEIDDISKLKIKTEMVSVSNSIFAAYSNEKGRHILAQDEIKAGEVIFVEKAYAFILLPEFYGRCCYHCLQKIKSFFPCRSCDKIFYCCSKCENRAWQQYHHIECRFQSIFFSIGIAHLSLKIILIAGFQFLIDIKPNLSQSYCDKLSFTNDYLSVYSLLTHQNEVQEIDMGTYVLTSILLLECLKLTDYFPSQDINTYDSNVYTYIGSLLLHHICQLICNGHAITTLSTKESENAYINAQQQIRIATAIYPSTSLMNHSCIPNVISSFENDLLIVRVIADVKKGDEIFNCYGPHYLRMNKDERQLCLKEQYYFDCTCTACLNGPQNLWIFKCLQCGGKVQLQSNYVCLDCKSEFTKFESTLEQAEIADNLIILTEKCLNSNEIQKALEYCKQCLLIRQSIMHPSSKDLALVIDFMAHCFACLGDFKSAYNYLKESIEIIRNYYGSNSIEYANDIVKFIEVCYQAGETDLVPEFTKNAENIFSIYYGKECPQIHELRDLTSLKHIS